MGAPTRRPRGTPSRTKASRRRPALGVRSAGVLDMATSIKRLTVDDVLCYRIKGASRDTVRRHYLRWRPPQDPPLPERCDNPDCLFHTHPLVWNDKPLKPILDHIDGHNTDNRPEMLRLLCPHCDAPLETRGGANKGRIEKATGGFAKLSRDGKRCYVLLNLCRRRPTSHSSGRATSRAPLNSAVRLLFSAASWMAARIWHQALVG